MESFQRTCSGLISNRNRKRKNGVTILLKKKGGQVHLVPIFWRLGWSNKGDRVRWPGFFGHVN
jgi:hypothetical protein